jgi:DNA-binding LacI/PurR family transcriptional regulator
VSTIRDVARHAEVGVGTVSRYLNGAPVKPKTAARIDAAITELAFVTNRAARGLARGRVPTIGVLLPFVTSPSAMERVRGIIEHARPTGLPVSIFDVEQPHQLDEHVHAMCHDLRPEALLVVSLHLGDEHLAALEASRLEPVFLDVEQPGRPMVTVDDVEGGRIATRHLLDLGHERIAFVGDHESSSLAFTSSARRRRGYAEVLTEAGVSVPDTYTALGLHGADPAAASTQELLSGDQPPTAIFAASDTQALGAMRAAREMGLRVPEDLSVIGFDDIESAHWSGLTTVRQPLREMSGQAMEMVQDLMQGCTPDPLQRTGALELVARGTTAPPR